MAIIRGGKAQGVYIADLDSATNKIIITEPIELAEPFKIGDRLVDSNFYNYTVTAVSANGKELTVAETILSSSQGKYVHDASGTMMVVYVFVQETIVFANTSTRISLKGYDIAG